MSSQNLTKTIAWLFCAALLCVMGVVAAEEQRHYATPDEAVDALIAAAAAEDPDAVRTVLGSDVEGLRSGDPVADAQEREDFVAAALEAANIEEDGDDFAVLAIGNDNWPFPIPLVRDDQGWRFDTVAGTEELLDRRIGRNELHAIAVLRALVEAQHEYAAEDRNGDGMRDGRLAGGFAFLAYPAEYGQSGIMTLTINDSGFMFEKDLGEVTATQVAGITKYDPAQYAPRTVRSP